MDLNTIISTLKSSDFITKMNTFDNQYFLQTINNMKPFNNINYFIDTYNFSNQDIKLIEMYNFAVNMI
jgi:hypothetical protein